MYSLRPKSSLGGQDHGWLQTHHHFSFANYTDSARMGWGILRVINDDTIAPGTGFAAHAHSNMEIITYVRAGTISHRDNMGNSGRTEAGHVQVMTAGTGVVHEEYNHETVTTQIFQIWLQPNAFGLKPRWSVGLFATASNAVGLTHLASGRTPTPGAMDLNADADIYSGHLACGTQITYVPQPGRMIYIVLADGLCAVHGTQMKPGDGMAIKDEAHVDIEATGDCSLLLVDAAPA